MINFRKIIVPGLVAVSLGMGIAAMSTPATAWDFQHRNFSSGFNQDQYWGPGVGGVAPVTTYDVYADAHQPSCYLTVQTAFGKYGFAYYAVERVCH